MKFELVNVTKWKWINTIDKPPYKLTILDDISFESCGDGIHVILGPSGSGKTTLLRLLNKLDSPSSGKILIDKQDIAEITPGKLRQDIGMVFQTPALFDGTIEDNLLYGPRINRLASDTPSVDELLKAVDLEILEPSRQADSLSIGQQQRISFARALANNPKVLLLDEPTSALDPTAANKLLDIIKKINSQMSIDIIMVTHILPHARKIADNVCLLMDGKIAEHGPAQQFFQSPQSDVGKKFILGEM